MVMSLQRRNLKGRKRKSHLVRQMSKKKLQTILLKNLKKIESTASQLIYIEPTKDEKPQQSYLALTGLGGPEKKQEPKQNTQGTRAGGAAPSNPGFYSFLK